MLVERTTLAREARGDTLAERSLVSMSGLPPSVSSSLSGSTAPGVARELDFESVPMLHLPSGLSEGSAPRPNATGTSRARRSRRRASPVPARQFRTGAEDLTRAADLTRAEDLTRAVDLTRART